MRRRIFLNAFLVGLAALGLCVTMFFGVLYNYYEKQTFTQLSMEAACVSQGLELNGASYFDGLTASDRLTWVASDGTVLYDSAADAETMENHANRTEISQALETGSGQSARYSSTLMEKTLYYALRLSDGTVLRVSCDRNAVTAMLLQLAGPIAWIVVLIVVLSGLLAYRLARQITKPINAMDLNDPEAGRTYQELQPLITHLREQNHTIRQQMEELSMRQREFTAITDNMSEGFLLVDGRTNVLSSNRSAVQLLDTGAAGTVSNLRRDACSPEICAAVENALAGVRTEKLLKLDGGGTYQLIANPVIASGQVAGVVVITMDVTEREEREALRREFSANVSHELKTPLTSISGFAELMQQGLVPPDKVREFSGDIYRESQRLINLVDDIINLSRLDENYEMPDRESVDLYDLSEEVLAELKPIADKRGITLSLEGEHEKITGVWQILNEMVFNLCDNAVKYNKDGGSVAVSVRKAGSEVRLSVRDTGVGIPYAHQNRVFERFYRVDKSHSKEIGGTGLGLSIVKHGALYHNARIELESTPGAGTEITIIF